MKLYASCDGLSLVPDKSYNCGPGLFRFELTGATGAKQIIWNFGDGDKTAPDSLYQYLFKTGKIDVQVKVLWGNGSRCDTTFKQVVEIKPLPIPLVKVSNNRLCNGPDTVRFTCLNVGYQNISWIVDGTNYFNYGNSVLHKFTTIGKKGLNIVYIDSFGCRGIAELKDTVHIFNKIDLDFKADYNEGCAPKQIQISPTINLNGEAIKNVIWKIQGQNPDSYVGLNLPSLNYKTPGEFDVGLTIETQNGCFFNLNYAKFIRIGDSVPIVLSKPKLFYCFNENIVISDLFNKNGGSYQWTYPNSAQVIGDSTKNYIVLKINKNGTYKVDLSYERNGCVTNASMKDSIVIKQITAAFSSANNYHCEAPLKVSFTNESFATDSGEMIYQWYFYKAGSNTILNFSNVKNPDITFDQIGEYDVRLIVKHKISGCIDTITKPSFVRLDTIRPQMVISPRIGCVNQIVNFYNATQSSSFQAKDTFYWTLYNSDGKSILKGSDSQNFSYQFKNPGLYKVALFAGNNSGCSVKKTIYDTVEIVVPKLNYFILPPNICVGNQIRLAGATTPTRAKFTHFWEIKNQDSLFKFSTTDSLIQLNNLGLYDVKYAIQIGNGCRDSLVQKDAIGINGVSAKIDLDTTTGCLPFEVNASFSNVVNFHNGSGSNAINQVWRVTPNNGVVFSDSLAKTTKVTFNEVGAYVLSLYLKNATGCDSIIQSETIYAGVDANFTLSDYRICIGDEIVATTSSKLKPSTYYWKVSSSDVSLSSTTDSFTRITTNTEGNYWVTLIAEKNGICFDTLSVGFEAIEVLANFETLDTLLTCAPVYAQFISTSKNADRLIWNYGDGQQFVTKSPNSGHIYSANSGWSEGFDVELLAENDEGCSSTLKREDYVWVLGPVPKVILSNYKGCDPLEVTLTDKSRDAVKYIVDFGDNKAWDSTYLTTMHTYNFSKINSDTQSFVLRLFTYDSLGCIAEYEPFEKIELYRKPTIDKVIDSTVVCNPSEVKFYDNTLSVVNRTWTLKYGNSTITNDSSYWKHLFDTDGTYPVSLQVTNYMNCVSTATDSIIVRPNVNANVEIKDSACLFSSLQFKTSASSNAPITANIWLLSLNGSTIDQKVGTSVNFTFQSPGNYNLNLQSFNQFGCSDTIDKIIYVADPQKSVKPQIKLATITASNQTELFCFTSLNNRFNRYDVLYNGNSIKGSFNRSDTNWRALAVKVDDNNPQCYALQETDICGFKSLSEEHCPVILTSSSVNNYAINLNWTAYKGWSDLLEYNIYRSFDNGKFESIYKCNKNQLNYTDSPLCPGLYAYKIEAISQIGFKSYSNISNQIPRYQKIDNSIDIREIQVVNNQYLQIKWDSSSHPRHHHYLINKWRINGSEQLKMEGYLTQERIWLDNNVLPSTYSYQYEVYDIDQCDETNPQGRYGKSILLKGNYIQEQANLNWSAYMLWEFGINEQQIQIEKANGFVNLEKLNSTQFNFTDNQIHTDIKGDYCYKIVAVSNPNQMDTSTSNVV